MRETINNIQALRFFAAFAVVFAHLQISRYSSVGVKPETFAIGAFGVDIFFVISGFIMSFVSSGMNGDNHKKCVEFFLKRIFRVVPLYWIFTFIAYNLAFMSISCPANLTICPWYLSENYNFAKTSFDWLFQSLTFTNWTRGPIYSVGWTLIYEFWFYVLFSVCILIGVRPVKFFTSLLILVALAGLPTFSGIVPDGMMTLVLHPFMIEFIMGVYLYEIYKAKLLNNKLILPFALVCAVLGWLYQMPEVLALFGSYSRPVLCGGAAFCVVAIALTLEQSNVKANRLLVSLGDSSYSLYLTHWLVVTNLPSFIDIYGYSSMSFSTFILLNVTISMIMSQVVYYLIEKPLRKSARVIVSDILISLRVKQKPKHAAIK